MESPFHDIMAVPQLPVDGAARAIKLPEKRRGGNLSTTPTTGAPTPVPYEHVSREFNLAAPTTSREFDLSPIFARAPDFLAGSPDAGRPEFPATAFDTSRDASREFSAVHSRRVSQEFTWKEFGSKDIIGVSHEGFSAVSDTEIALNTSIPEFTVDLPARPEQGPRVELPSTASLPATVSAGAAQRRKKRAGSWSRRSSMASRRSSGLSTEGNLDALREEIRGLFTGHMAAVLEGSRRDEAQPRTAPPTSGARRNGPEAQNAKESMACTIDNFAAELDR